MGAYVVVAGIGPGREVYRSNVRHATRQVALEEAFRTVLPERVMGTSLSVAVREERGSELVEPRRTVRAATVVPSGLRKKRASRS